MSTKQINTLYKVKDLVTNPSLKSKIEQLISKKENKHLINDPEYISLSGMGVLKLRHVSLDKGIFLFDSDIKEKNIVEIEIYTAKQHRFTKKIEPLELKTKVQMTISQYSNLLITMNAEGSHATMTHLNGELLPDFDKEKDPSFQLLSKLEAFTLSNSDQQIYSFLSEAENLVEQALEDKKIKSSTLKDVTRLINGSSGNALSNYLFYVKQYGKEANKHTEQGLLSTHTTFSYVNDSYNFARSYKLTKKD